MLYRIGTSDELAALRLKLPECVMTELSGDIATLDAEYGAARDYLLTGGYSLIAETCDDISRIKSIIDYDEHPCEWALRIGGYIAALYALNNDYTITVYLPAAIAPNSILKDLEE